MNAKHVWKQSSGNFQLRHLKKYEIPVKWKSDNLLTLRVQVNFFPGIVYLQFPQVNRKKIPAASLVNYPRISLRHYYNLVKYIQGQYL